MYQVSELGEKENYKVKWIDDGENDKNKLRTNPSEDDLCLKETVEPITVHKEEQNTNSVIKVKTEANIITTGIKPSEVFHNEQVSESSNEEEHRE